MSHLLTRLMKFRHLLNPLRWYRLIRGEHNDVDPPQLALPDHGERARSISALIRTYRQLGRRPVPMEEITYSDVGRPDNKLQQTIQGLQQQVFNQMGIPKHFMERMQSEESSRDEVRKQLVQFQPGRPETFCIGNHVGYELKAELRDIAFPPESK